MTSSLSLTPAEEISKHINYWFLALYCILLFIIGGVSTLIIVLSGIKLITTENLSKREKAKKKIKYTLLALILVLLVCR